MGRSISERHKSERVVSVADEQDIFCDFEDDDCPLQQEKADDQEDWHILEASSDEKGGIDHTTQSGEENIKLVRSEARSTNMG